MSKGTRATSQGEEMKVAWVDSGREPQCKPDSNYPNGKDLDISLGKRSCLVELPYPAKRCGYYVIECEKCNFSMACTTAGRPDDPKSLRVPCK